MSLTHSSPSRSKRFSIQASLCSPVVPLSLSALVDSGAEENFVDEEVAQQAGFPIEQLHNPHIDWPAGKIINWSSYCHSVCLQSALPPTEGSFPPPQYKTRDLSSVSATYHDLARVFCKDSALSLLPHRPYDCTIDLVPAASSTTSLAQRGRPWRNTLLGPWQLASLGPYLHPWALFFSLCTRTKLSAPV